MALQKYKESSLLFNQNFLDETSTSGLFSYRGELVIVPGEVADDKGHLKPPVEVMLGVAILADEKIKLIIGQIDDMASFPVLVEKYKEDFSPEMKAVIYVVNLEKEIQVEVEGVKFVLIPLIQGVPWNEILDEVRLEKSDFKGQSSADKLVTLLEEMSDYKPKYPEVSLDEALTMVTEAKREGWGAV